VIDLESPWLCFDHVENPYQLENLVGRSDKKEILAKLDKKLHE
jgi:hypothetical protein